MPEMLLERTIIWGLCKQLCKLRWWTRIKLDHQEAPFNGDYRGTSFSLPRVYLVAQDLHELAQAECWLQSLA